MQIRTIRYNSGDVINLKYSYVRFICVLDVIFKGKLCGI